MTKTSIGPRVHFSNAPLVDVKDRRDQTMNDDGLRPGDGHHKPRGLWYSCQGCVDNWLQWCIDEDFRTYTYAAELGLDMSRILKIRTPAALRAFSAEYAYGSSMRMRVAWAAVASRWGGIEIAPHLRDCRHQDLHYWYTTWDVASGCVWDPNVVVGIWQRHVEEFPPMEHCR